MDVAFQLESISMSTDFQYGTEAVRNVVHGNMQR